MSRIEDGDDMDKAAEEEMNSKPRTVSSLSPGADEIKQRLKVEMEKPNEPIKSASQYSKMVAQRRAVTAALKKENVPLGGADPIPPGKLASLSMPKPKFAEDHEPPPPINKQEMLQGVGAAYPVNQAMARGDVRAPMSMKEAKQMGGMNSKPSRLSEDTVEGLKKIEEYNKANPPNVAPEADDDEAVKREKEELEQAEREIAEGVPIDFASLVGARNELYTEKRRKDIESRLSKLDIADMITNRELRQVVPVIPGRFELMLRTFSQVENLFCLRHLSEYPGSTIYQEELLSTFKMTCAIVAVNGSLLPEHRKDIGTRKEEVDAEKFKEKLHTIATFPTQIVADFSVQNIWFQRRVEKLFSWENLKNG